MTTTTTTTARVTPSAGDQAAVAFIPSRVVAAWNAQNPDAFANVFSDGGTMILLGEICRGREEIRAFASAVFAGRYRGARVSARPISVQFFGPHVGTLISEWSLLRPAGGEALDADTWQVSWVVVRSDRGWELAAYQSSPREPR